METNMAGLLGRLVGIGVGEVVVRADGVEASVTFVVAIVGDVALLAKAVELVSAAEVGMGRDSIGGSVVDKVAAVAVEFPVAIWGHYMEVAEDGCFDTGAASVVHFAEKRDIDGVEIETSLVDSARTSTAMVFQHGANRDTDQGLVSHVVKTAKESSQNSEKISGYRTFVHQTPASWNHSEIQSPASATKTLPQLVFLHSENRIPDHWDYTSPSFVLLPVSDVLPPSWLFRGSYAFHIWLCLLPALFPFVVVP